VIGITILSVGILLFMVPFKGITMYAKYA